MPGDAPSQSLQWAVQAVAKAGTIGVIGVYPPEMTSFIDAYEAFDERQTGWTKVALDPGVR